MRWLRCAIDCIEYATDRERTAGRRWALAASILVGCLLSRCWLLPGVLGSPFVTVYPATLACFLLCGFRPGAAVALLGAAGGNWLFSPPFSPIPTTLPGAVFTLVFLTSCLAVGSVIARMREVERTNGSLITTQAAMLESTLFGMSRTLDRRQIWVSPGLEALHGSARGELAGSPTRVLFDSDEAHRAFGDVAYRALREEGSYRAEVVMRRKDGTPVWLDASGTFLDRQTEEALWLFVDITARKESEQALRRSQSLLERTGAVAGVGGWEHDLASGVITWSDHTCRLHDVPLGTRPALEDVLGFYTEASRPVIEAAVREAMWSGTPWDLEGELISATGRAVSVRFSGAVEYENGVAVRLVGALQDVTDRRRLARKLADREARFRLAMDAGGIGMWDLDAATRTSTFDAVTAAMSDGLLPVDRPVDHAGPEFEAYEARVHPDDNGARKAVHAAFLRGQIETLDSNFRFRLDDGTWRWVSVRGQAVERDPATGRPRRALGIVSDETRQQEMHHQLRQRENEALRHAGLLRSIYGTTRIGLCLVDRDLRVLEMNECLANELGRRAEDCVGRLRSELGDLHGTNIYGLMRQVIETGVPVEGHEFSIPAATPDGARDWVLSIHPVRASDGAIIGAGKAVLEITSAKRAEHQLRRVNSQREELMRRQEAQLAELAEANSWLGMAEEVGRIGHWRRSLSGEVATWSNEMYRIFGVERERFVPTISAVAALYHPDDRARATEQMEAAARATAAFAFPVRLVRQGGTVVHALYKGFGKAGPDGQPALLFGIVVDVTEQHLAQAALLLANRRLEMMARQDGLTGIANRRRFDEALAQEWRVASRNGAHLSLALIDIDRFKLYNDRYGHQAGDDCLRAVAMAVLAVTRRPADLAARYGGEELVVLLPATDAEGAASVAEQLRFAVEALALRHDGNASCGGVVTASLGVATAIPSSGEPPVDGAALIAAADLMLYEAKRQGRNQVRVHTAPAASLPAPLAAVRIRG